MVVLAWEVPLALVGPPYELDSLSHQDFCPFFTRHKQGQLQTQARSVPMALRGPGDLKAPVSPD